MFIETINQGTINTDHAIQITQTWNKSERKHRIHCDMIDGRTIVAEVAGYVEIEPRRKSVIPAQSGYFLLTYFGPEKEFVDRWPVLAWALDPELGFHEAITLDNSVADDVAILRAILCPDGRMISPGDASWKTEADWIEYARRDAQKQKAAAS